MVADSAVLGVMADLFALDTLSFPHTFHMFLWSEFLQLHKAYFHGIRVLEGSGSGGILRSKAVVMSPPTEFIDMVFVTIEGFGLFYPFLKSVWWGDVMKFIPLHDIPYIFLSPDSQPYLSIDKFLSSPDQDQNLSTFIPNALFP